MIDLPLPTKDDIRAAFERGTSVVAGWPVLVTLAAGGVASLDIAGTMRMKKPQWHVRRWLLDGTVLELTCPGDRTLYVDNMEVTSDNLGRVDAAIAAAPREEDRHTATAEIARQEAAQHAMKIEDAMIRARMLDALEAWGAVMGEVIDDDPDHGVLAKCVDEAIRAVALKVRCPSTGREYVHLVPQTMTTAKEARLWVMGLDEVPEVET